MSQENLSEKSEAPKKPKRFGSFPCIILQGLIAMVWIIVIAAAVFVWRVHSKPIELGFLKNTIEAALDDPATGIYPRFDKVVLHWPDLRGPLLLGLQNGAVYNADHTLILSVAEAAISLNETKLLIGQISPEDLILRGPSLRVIRGSDNSFDFGFESGQGDVRPKQSEEQEALTTTIVRMMARPNHLGQDAGPLADLKTFQIDDARVIVDDRVLNVSWLLPRLDLVFESTDTGLYATYAVDLPVSARFVDAPMSKLSGNVSFDWASKISRFNAQLENFEVGTLAEKIPELALLKRQKIPLNVSVSGVLNEQFQLAQGAFTVTSAAGNIDTDGFYEEALPYKDFSIQGDYKANNKALSVEAFQITLEDVTFAGNAEFAAVEGDSHQGSVRLEIETLDQNQIPPLWPKALEDDVARKWVIDRTRDGVFSNVIADFKISAQRDENGALSANLDNVTASFDFDNLTVDYRAPLTPVTQSNGSMTFDYNAALMRFNIEGGALGGLTIDKAEIELSNIIEKGQGVADIHLKMNGPAKSVLDYITKEPIEANIDPSEIALTRGATDMMVNLNFPTRDDVLAKDVELLVQGTLRDAFLPNIINDMPLTGGPYDVSIKDRILRVRGKGALGGQAIDLKYSEFLESEDAVEYESKVEAKLSADDAFRERMGIDLSEFLEGRTDLAVVYTEQVDGSGLADVDADITAARLFFDPVAYEKPVGQAGQVTLKAHLKNDNLTKITDLRGTAPALKVEKSVLGFRENKGETELASGDISRVVVGETIGTLDFDIAPNGLLTLDFKGPFLDARPFLGDEESGEEDETFPMRISVATDAMRTADEEIVQYAKLYMDMNVQGRIDHMEMDGIAGSGDIYLRFKPGDNGQRNFRLEADDAGAALRAFQVYDNMRGGKLVIIGTPQSGPMDRNLAGKAEISDFKVVKAPFLARLMGAMSLQGLATMLNSEGVEFSRLEADFDWKSLVEGGQVVLKNGRSSGNSLGLTFEGNYISASQKIDIGGTIVPLSGVNNIIGQIPLVGDILTGGSGGIFAATYTIRGEDGEEPNVSVNPLSVLAPGILRRILFEGGVESSN